MRKIEKTLKGHCPKCGPNVKAHIRGSHEVTWADNDSPISGSNTGYILECGGCETVYFCHKKWFSEWDELDQDPYSGELRMNRGIETTYWPTPVARERPEWLFDLEHQDETLGNLVTETYCALDANLRVLAAIGIRTVFDRSSELLGISTSLSVANKLSSLVSAGKIGDDEKKHLEVLVDAGSAAAHRAWKPSSRELATMMKVVEPFLHRSFILSEGVDRLKDSVPPRSQ